MSKKVIVLGEAREGHYVMFLLKRLQLRKKFRAAEKSLGYCSVMLFNHLQKK